MPLLVNMDIIVTDIIVTDIIVTDIIITDIIVTDIIVTNIIVTDIIVNAPAESMLATLGAMCAVDCSCRCHLSLSLSLSLSHTHTHSVGCAVTQAVNMRYNIIVSTMYWWLYRDSGRKDAQ